MTTTSTQDNLLRFERAPFSGAYTVNVAALLLRATTPPPKVPINLWDLRRRRLVNAPPIFVATPRALYSWIRLGVLWDRPSQVGYRERAVNFDDLIRLRLISVFRARGFTYREILEAEQFARQRFQIPQPFITEPLWTSGDIFMAFSDKLVALTKHGQLGLDLLREFLIPTYHGLSFDSSGEAAQWTPYANVVIDPGIQFGSPCVANTRIETEALWAFKEAGDSEESIARMYGLEIALVRDALGWERIVSLAA